MSSISFHLYAIGTGDRIPFILPESPSVQFTMVKSHNGVVTLYAKEMPLPSKPLFATTTG